MLGIFGGAKQFDGIVSDTGTHGRLDTTNGAIGTLDVDLNAGLGTDGSGESPANGTGVRGWLRGIYDKLNGTLTVTVTNPTSSTVSVSNFPATQPVSAAALPLPSGASTSANQTTGNTSLATIATNSATAATAANQATANTSLASIATNTTGASTAANQTSANTKLDTVHTDLGHMTDGTQQTQVIASAANGYTLAKLISAATTNATSLKASAGTVGLITAANLAATPRYLKLYNKASAPAVGTDVPVAVFIIPGSASSPTPGAGTNVPVPPQGLNFSLGIAYAVTTGITDADTGAVGASEVAVTFGYK